VGAPARRARGAATAGRAQQVDIATCELTLRSLRMIEQIQFE
jgi:hypothetical protein